MLVFAQDSTAASIRKNYSEYERKLRGYTAEEGLL